MSEEVWGTVLDKIADSLDRIATVLEKKGEERINKIEQIWSKLTWEEQQAVLNRKEENER